MTERTPMVQDTAPWLIIWAIGLAGGSYGVCYLGGTLGEGLDTGQWKTPTVSVANFIKLLTKGPAGQFPNAAPSAVYSGIAIVLILALVLVGVVVWQIRRHTSTKGLAKARDLTMLHGPKAKAKALALRDDLTPDGPFTPDDLGPLLGDLDPYGPELHASYEDSLVCVMPPRSGKSTCIAGPAVLRAPGAVVNTSNKSDVYALTKRRRAKVGTCWTFDPQKVAFAKRAMWFDLLFDARNPEGARRLAGHFTANLTADMNNRDFWATAAGNLLTELFHAAAIAETLSTADVLEWLSGVDRTPADILLDHGKKAMGDHLLSTIKGAVETREGIYETARQAVACLTDPAILDWVSPHDNLPQFKPAEFVLSKDTLYLLSKEGGGGASPLIAALCDATMRAAAMAAELRAGRLATPLTVVLDEACNVCKIADLPDLYSHFGSRGVILISILQSYKQGVRVWGEHGMDALWGAATVKILGSGLDDADFVDKLSRLVGEHKVEETSQSHSPGNRSVTVSKQRERILPVETLRAMPKGRALLLVTGVRAAVIKLRPWYEESDKNELAEAFKVETRAISQRALALAAGPGIGAGPSA